MRVCFEDVKWKAEKHTETQKAHFELFTKDVL